MSEQKSVQAKVKDIIEIDGLKFKDLNNNGKLDPYEDWRLSPEDRAKDLVQRMTNAEKAGMFVINAQMMGITAKAEGAPTSYDGILSEKEAEAEGPSIPERIPTLKSIQDLNVRHYIVRENSTPEEMATWINTLQEVAEGTRLGIPMIVTSNSKNENLEAHIDFEDAVGKFTQFPGTLGLAAANDADLIKDFAEVGYQEFLASGIRKGYMYMLDTATDPRWFRTSGTFGENPEQISEIGQTVIEAYQGEELNEESIALTIKHFPGGAARENGFDPHYEEGKFNVYATEGSLEKYHLPPFVAAIEKNPASIMPYYAIPSNEKSATPQAPFTTDFEKKIAFAYNEQFINGLLIEQLGFKGYVNSDTGVLGDMAWGVENLSKTERAAKILEAGTNIVSGEGDPAPFLEALEQNLVDEDIVNKSVEKLLYEKFALGLFDNPYVDEKTANDKVKTETNKEKAYEAHQKSVVLLKNKDNLLPLTADKLKGKKVYIELFTKVYNEKEMEGRARQGIFGNTDAVAEKLPTYLQNHFPEIEVVENYNEADIAILLVEPITGSYFEATDGYLELGIHEETNIDLAKIKAIRKAVPQVVINVNLDLPMLLNNIEPLADALTASFDTFISAIIDVFVGELNPSAKLPISLPANEAAIHVNEDGICASPNDVPGYDKERYMDIPYIYTDSEENRYSYGFGLSY